MKTTLYLTLALIGIGAASPEFARSGEAVVSPHQGGAALKFAAWEKPDAAESSALLSIAVNPALTSTNWGVTQAALPLGNESQSLIAQNTYKALPADPEAVGKTKIRVFDHLMAVPAKTESVYKEIEVEAGSAAP